MKKTIALLGLSILFLSATLCAQPSAGKKFEFSTSASFSSIKYKDHSESSTLFNFPVRLGYFIFKGLEIEPEFIFTIPDESKNTGYFLMGNLAYNFKTSGKTMPFVLAGVGYGNGEPLLSWTMDLDTGVTAYNLGAGIKYLVGDSAAVRVEYRFTHYAGKKTETWENEYYSYSYTNIYDRTDHQVLVGISLFF